MSMLNLQDHVSSCRTQSYKVFILKQPGLPAPHQPWRGQDFQGQDTGGWGDDVAQRRFYVSWSFLLHWEKWKFYLLRCWAEKKQVFDRETHVARTLGVQGVFVGRHAGCHIDCDSRYSFSSYVNFSSRFGHVWNCPKYFKIRRWYLISQQTRIFVPPFLSRRGESEVLDKQA